MKFSLTQLLLIFSLIQARKTRSFTISVIRQKSKHKGATETLRFLLFASGSVDLEYAL